MTTKELPGTSFSLLAIHAVDQHHDIGDGDDPELSSARSIAFAWDWRLGEPGEFEVLLGVNIGSTKEVPETIKFAVVGRFRILGPSSAKQVRNFARINGPSILMPYVREGVSALTSRGPYGTYLIPPVNVLKLEFNEEEATAIAEMAERPDWLVPEKGTSPQTS